jgi:hypothetical protein
MKFAFIAGIIVAAVWFYPLAMEGADDPCRALASQALRIETQPDAGPTEADAVTLIRPMGDFVFSETIEQQYPSISPAIICTGYYWRLIAEPGLVAAIKPPTGAVTLTDR